MKYKLFFQSICDDTLIADKDGTNVRIYHFYIEKQSNKIFEKRVNKQNEI
jgi:hypothetical protein